MLAGPCRFGQTLGGFLFDPVEKSKKLTTHRLCVQPPKWFKEQGAADMSTRNTDRSKETVALLDGRKKGQN
jgi:hypothetical protein